MASFNIGRSFCSLFEKRHAGDKSCVIKNGKSFNLEQSCCLGDTMFSYLFIIRGRGGGTSQKAETESKTETVNRFHISYTSWKNKTNKTYCVLNHYMRPKRFRGLIFTTNAQRQRCKKKVWRDNYTNCSGNMLITLNLIWIHLKFTNFSLF